MAAVGLSGTRLPAEAGKALSDELMGAEGLFGPDGRDIAVVATIDDRDSNRWRASGLYRVRTKVRLRVATGVGQAAALAALMQFFVRNHAGRRWRLLGLEPMAGKVTKARRRRKREEP